MRVEPCGHQSLCVNKNKNGRARLQIFLRQLGRLYVKDPPLSAPFSTRVGLFGFCFLILTMICFPVNFEGLQPSAIRHPLVPTGESKK
jgi:hypothetical protein